jgi:hypothetical protein
VSLVLYMFWDIPSTRMRLVDGEQSSLLPTAAAPPTAYQIAVNYGKKNRLGMIVWQYVDVVGAHLLCALCACVCASCMCFVSVSE